MTEMKNSELFEIERKKTSEMTDRELSRILERNWNENNFADTTWSSEDKDQLFEKISSRISAEDNHDTTRSRSERQPRIVATIMKYASTVLLPLFIFSTIYYHHSATHDIDCTTVITTGQGETATVTLPDGTEIKINNKSVLSYNPHSFAKGKRTVNLNGEAFFSVANDRSNPFSVNASGISVNVLGTKFNVRSRETENVASVFLTEGSVVMHCDGVKRNIVLETWQKAVFNKYSDTVEISDVDNNAADIAWLKNELAFNDTPFTTVISEIETRYGVSFNKSTMSSMLDDRFTGTLPGDDISTVLDILEDVYDVEFTLDRRMISVK